MRNFKKIVTSFLIVVIAVSLFIGLDYLLYPCTFVRNDVHAVSEKAYQDIYLGTSHGKIGIDPAVTEQVNGRTAHNLCVGGEYAPDSYYLLKLLIEQGNKPERVIFEVAYGYLVQEKEEGNNYLLFYHEFPFSRTKLEYFVDQIMKCNFRTWLFPWYEYPLAYEVEHRGETLQKTWNHDYSVESMKTDVQEYHENGFIERYAVDTSKLAFEGVSEFRKEDLKAENMEYLDRLIQLCKDNDIEFVGITMPVPGYTLKQFEAGFQEYEAYFTEYFKERNVRYIDFNGQEFFKCYSHKIEHYTDYDGHLNGESAREFSGILARVLDGKRNEAKS